MAWGWPGDGLLVAVVLVVLDSHSQEIADTKQELTEKHEMLEKTKTLGSREIWGSPNRVHVLSGNPIMQREHRKTIRIYRCFLDICYVTH